MKCKRCQKELQGKQTSYCSLRCSKLHLKSLWRKRTRDKQNVYNRNYRSQGLRPLSGERKRTIFHSFGDSCLRCGTQDSLNVHHIKPLRLGGTHKTIVVLCFTCHMEFEKRMTGYWKYPLSPVERGLENILKWGLNQRDSSREVVNKP